MLGAGLLGALGSDVIGSNDRHFGALAWRRGNAVQMRRSNVPVVRRRFAMHLATQTKPFASRKKR